LEKEPISATHEKEKRGKEGSCRTRFKSTINSLEREKGRGKQTGSLGTGGEKEKKGRGKKLRSFNLNSFEKRENVDGGGGKKKPLTGRSLYPTAPRRREERGGRTSPLGERGIGGKEGEGERLIHYSAVRSPGGGGKKGGVCGGVEGGRKRGGCNRRPI